MASRRFLDMMQNYPFWVMDASGQFGNPLFSIFDPFLGFSSVTSPEITVEVKEVKPGNWEYKRKAVKAAEVAPIVLSRGARFYDSDFYNWISKAIRGIQPVRRNLVIIHFLGFRLARAINQPEIGQSGVQNEVALNAAGQVGIPLDRIPGRAWYCGACIPTRYKSASDFDARSSDVSIMELEVQPEYVHELTISTLTPQIARASSLSFATLEAAGVGGF